MKKTIHQISGTISAYSSFVPLIILLLFSISCTKKIENPTNNKNVFSQNGKRVGDIQNIPQVMMTLDAITDEVVNMQSRDEVVAYLKNPAYATNGKWDLVWLDAASTANKKECAMITRYNGDDAGPGVSLAISFAGTNFSNFSNIMMDCDLNVLGTMIYTNLDYFNAHPNDKPSVSAGLNEATSLYNVAIDPLCLIPDASIKAFLVTSYKQAAELGNLPLNLYFTGHSQGAAAAVVFAQMLFQNLDDLYSISKQYGVKLGKKGVGDGFPINIYLNTFALPKFGTQGLTDYMNALPDIGNGVLNLQSFDNYYVQEDQVPFIASNFNAIGTPATMSNYPTGGNFTAEVSGVTNLFNNVISAAGISYTPTYAGIQVDHNLGQNSVPASNFKVPTTLMTLLDFGSYMEWNHNHNVYLTMLGAPLVPDPSSGVNNDNYWTNDGFDAIH
ncbi:MAG: hypothetical protein QM528_04595 [Phycisphaerales bacterium]|nr:hypothetical protein [Phycisphaerales bacterium]